MKTITMVRAYLSEEKDHLDSVSNTCTIKARSEASPCFAASPGSAHRA